MAKRNTTTKKAAQAAAKDTEQVDQEKVSESSDPVQPALMGETPLTEQPDVPVPTTVDLEVTTDNAIADGEAEASIQVTVTDGEQAAVSGIDVSLAVTGSAVLSTESGTTNAQGKVTANLTNTVVEAVTVTATVEGINPETSDVTFVAIPPVTMTLKNNSVYGVDILLQRGNLNIKGHKTTGPVTLEPSEADWLREHVSRFPAIEITESS